MRRFCVLVAVATGVGMLGGPAPATAKVNPEFFGAMVVGPEERDFAQMERVGVGSYRFSMSWRAIQQSRNGPYNWNVPDRQFGFAADHGLKPVPVLFGTPTFISREVRIRPPVRSKRNRQAWRDFVEAAVARYGRGGTFWQTRAIRAALLDPPAPPPPQRPATDWIIWNEQNAIPYWRPRVKPGEYATLVRISRRAIDSVDPRGRLVTGGMYGYPRDPKSMNAAPFLRRLYQRKGMRRAIDGVSLHPYAGGLKGVRRQIKQMRRVVRRAGDGKVSLWVGELGWASAGDRRHMMVKSPKQQARLLRRSMGMLLNNRGRWNVRSVFWYHWRDYARDPRCVWCSWAGLAKRDGSLKPAGRAYRNLIRSHR